MKKIMLSALVAVAALVSCNKEALPEAAQSLKSVEVNIDNLVFTKADVSTAINDGDAVKLNNLKIYLVDADGKFYGGLTADGKSAAKDYFTAAEAKGTYSFHYVDRKVVSVIAVANNGDKTYANETALNEVLVSVDAQQDPDALLLYDKKDVTKVEDSYHQDTENGENKKNEVYKAELNLIPRIARFEVDGVQVKFAGTAFESVDVLEMGFTNYHTSTVLGTLAPTGLVNAVENYSDETAVYNWFQTNDPAHWAVYEEAIELTPASPAESFAKAQAFHFIPGEAVPVFMFHLAADDVPAYVYTKNIKDEKGNTMKKGDFKAGYIYRFDADPTTAGNDGIIVIDNIDPMDRCLDITVKVEPWHVQAVVAEF